MTFKLYLQFLVVIFYHIEFAKATYSLVATDAKTRQVGGIGATCLPGWDVYESLYISAPNQSVLHTQGWLLSRDPEHPIVTLAKEKMKDLKMLFLNQINLSIVHFGKKLNMSIKLNLISSMNMVKMQIEY